VIEMKMYHKNSQHPVDVHPSKIESMKNKGWKVKPPTKPTEAKENG